MSAVPPGAHATSSYSDQKWENQYFLQYFVDFLVNFSCFVVSVSEYSICENLDNKMPELAQGPIGEEKLNSSL